MTGETAMCDNIIALGHDQLVFVAQGTRWSNSPLPVSSDIAWGGPTLCVKTDNRPSKTALAEHLLSHKGR
jgi:hypothetical protein